MMSVAVDYQHGIFAGTYDVIGRITGTPPMTVEAFVDLLRDEFAGECLRRRAGSYAWFMLPPAASTRSCAFASPLSSRWAT